MPKTQVAVEITEESVRAIEVSLGRTPTVVAAGEVPVPPGAAKDSEVLDRDAVAVALQRLWAEARISQRNVVLGVGNRRILVREHSTQLTNPAQIRQALPFEVQDRLPVPVDQAVLDFVPTAQDDRGVHGLLVAAVAEHMEELVGALDKARLRPLSIDLVAFGYARALATLVDSSYGEVAQQLGAEMRAGSGFARVMMLMYEAEPMLQRAVSAGVLFEARFPPDLAVLARVRVVRAPPLPRLLELLI